MSDCTHKVKASSFAFRDQKSTSHIKGNDVQYTSITSLPHFVFLFILVKTKAGYTIVAKEEDINGENYFSLPYVELKEGTAYTLVSDSIWLQLQELGILVGLMSEFEVEKYINQESKEIYSVCTFRMNESEHKENPHLHKHDVSSFRDTEFPSILTQVRVTERTRRVLRQVIYARGSHNASRHATQNQPQN